MLIQVEYTQILSPLTITNSTRAKNVFESRDDEQTNYSYRGVGSDSAPHPKSDIKFLYIPRGKS